MNRKDQVFLVIILPVRVPWPWTPTSPYWMWTPVWTRPTVPSPQTVPAQTAPGSAFPASPADWNTTGSYPQRRSASWSAGVTPSPLPRGAPSLNCVWKSTKSIHWWQFIYSVGEVGGRGVHRNNNLALSIKMAFVVIPLVGHLPFAVKCPTNVQYIHHSFGGSPPIYG